jgi:hypothetical protein
LSLAFKDTELVVEKLLSVDEGRLKQMKDGKVDLPQIDDKGHQENA